MEGDSEEEQDFGDVKGEYDSSDGDLSASSTDTEGDSKRGKRRSSAAKEISQSPIISGANSIDYRRSALFKGAVRIKKKSSIRRKKSAVIVIREFSIPLPSLPLLTKKHLSEALIEFIWQEFIDYETDESELLLFEYIPKIIGNINRHFSYELSSSLLNLKILENDDYIEFREFTGKLSKYFSSVDPGLTSSAQPKLNYAATCCAQAACHQSDFAMTDYFNNDTYGRDGESVSSESMSNFSKRNKNDNIKYPYMSKMNKRREEDNYQLRVAYTRFLADNNGVLRNKHVLPIVHKLEIKYDTNKLPMFLVNRDYEDFLVPTFIDFVDIVDSLKIVLEELEDNDGLDSDLLLPLWLREQFLPSELMMFQHYFLSTLSDNNTDNNSDNKNKSNHTNNDNNSDHNNDNGRPQNQPHNQPHNPRIKESDDTFESEDPEPDLEFDNLSLRTSLADSNHSVVIRFRGILKSMNAELSDLEARTILSGYSKKDNGEDRLCLDYTTFVTIFLRVSSGALKCFPVRSALKELKSNLKVFEEINEISLDPVPYVMLRTYGGSPVTCDFVLTGGAETMYEGGAYCFRITLNSGHPYECPSVLFLTRVASVNVFNKIDGTGQLPHLKSVWDASWTLKRLLTHIVQLFFEPDLTLISPVYMQTAITWTYAKLVQGEIDRNERVKREEREFVGYDDDIGNEIENGMEEGDDNHGNEEKSGGKNEGKWSDDELEPLSEEKSDKTESKMESSEGKNDEKNNENYEENYANSQLAGVSAESKGGDEGGETKKTGGESERGEAKSDSKEPGEGGGDTREENVIDVGPILSYLRSMVPIGILIDAPALNLSSLASAEKQLNRFSKLEQIHLNAVCLYLYDYDQYTDMVKMFVEKYSIPVEYDRCAGSSDPEVSEPYRPYDSYESCSSALGSQYEEAAENILEEHSSVENLDQSTEAVAISIK